jgi:hypothetical protein
MGLAHARGRVCGDPYTPTWSVYRICPLGVASVPDNFVRLEREEEQTVSLLGLAHICVR